MDALQVTHASYDRTRRISPHSPVEGNSFRKICDQSTRLVKPLMSKMLLVPFILFKQFPVSDPLKYGSFLIYK